jgi:hypothetical protein
MENELIYLQNYHLIFVKIFINHLSFFFDQEHLFNNVYFGKALHSEQALRYLLRNLGWPEWAGCLCRNCLMSWWFSSISSNLFSYFLCIRDPPWWNTVLKFLLSLLSLWLPYGLNSRSLIWSGWGSWSRRSCG